MKKTIFILLLTILFTSLFSEISKDDYNRLPEDFKQILSVDAENKKLLEFDAEKINYEEYFYYFCIVSEEKENYSVYKLWLKNLETVISAEIIKKFGNENVKNWKSTKQEEFAEFLLMLLHSKVLKKYQYDAHRISSVINHGEYNCVSSSILYALFLKKYGLDVYGVETQDHVFVKINFRDKSIDAETTNRFGFDPGKKVEVLDDFGKVTGFSYVPQHDYINRNDIDLKKLLLIVYHNLSEYYYKLGEYIKSVNFGYILYLGRDDERGNEDFRVSFNNYIVFLSKYKQYESAIRNINWYLELFGENDYFLSLRFDLLNNYVYDWNDYAIVSKMDHYLLEENDRYDFIKNHQKFIAVYFLFIYKCTEFYNKKNDYNDSYNFIKKINSLFEYAEVEKLFSNILLSEMDYYDKRKDYNKVEKRFIELKLDFPEYIEAIKKHEKVYYINNINRTIKNGDAKEALVEAKKLTLLFPSDKDVGLTLRNAYVKYTIFLYENGLLKEVIKYSEEGLTKFPADSVLLNNYLTFFKNFITEAVDKRDFSEARRMVDLAIEKFGNDKYIREVDKYLDSISY